MHNFKMQEISVLSIADIYFIFDFYFLMQTFHETVKIKKHIRFILNVMAISINTFLY